MGRKKLKDINLEHEDYKGRFQMFTQLLLGFCTAQIALVRQKNPGVEFTVMNFKNNDQISEKDKKIIDKAFKRKKRIKTTESTRNAETEIFMRNFGVDMEKAQYTRDDLVELANKLSVLDMGVSVFRHNSFKKEVEHIITPVTSLPCYINMVEVDYNSFKWFESDKDLGFNYFCHECGKHEKAKAYHQCAATCKLCGRKNTLCKEGTDNIQCPDCNILFFSQDCYSAHKALNHNGLGSKCSAVHGCVTCSHSYQTRYKHICGQGGPWCRKCQRTHYTTQQWCTWTPMDEKKRLKKMKRQQDYRFAVFDIEAVQGEVYTDDKGQIKTKHQEHYANVVVVRMWCALCEYKDRLEPCVRCGDRERVFRYDNANDDTDKVINEFRDFILFDETTVDRTFFAHNAARYDNQMVLQSLIKAKIHPKTIMDGFAIVHMDVENSDKHVYFKDSYKLIPCPVADMAKNFKLDIGCKGTFPILYNRPENYGTVTPGLPEDMYFGILNEKKRKSLNEYRASLPADYQFDFDEEIVRYCKQDVAVVQEAIISSRNQIMKVTDWCPFSLCNTVASYVLFVLVNNFAPCDQMVYLPETGVSGKGIKQSEKAMKWLLWMEKQGGKRIRSVLNTGEYRVPGTSYHVDGFDGEIHYEYLGCYYHGCFCMGQDTWNKKLGKSMRQLYEETRRRHEKIRSLGLKLETVWECKIDEEIRKNPKMKRFFMETCVKHFTPLIPRRAVLGGRTENFRFHVVPGPNEKIYYLDIVSLYPYVMYDLDYPLGAPDCITDFTGIDLNAPVKWRGLIKAKVLPPQYLRLPVLGYPHNNRLSFPLCRICCEEENLKDQCAHKNPEDRAFVGTFTHVELIKAQSKGYRVLQYYEVWAWTEWTKNMYKEFIGIFLKMKVEASGWPPGVEGDQEKMDAFVERYKEKMGIDIDPANVRLAPGKRYYAKLMLNSLWGKMCQRDDLRKHEYTSQYQYFDKIEYDGFIVQSFKPIAVGTVFTTWKAIEEERHSSLYAALHHAAFVTSYGRLRLYDLLEKAGDGVIYCDTDSVMFLAPKDCNPMAEELGDFLGLLSDEVATDEEIVQVAAFAPKSYAVEIRKEGGMKRIFKIKGVQQSEETAGAIKFDNFIKLCRSRVLMAISEEPVAEFTIDVPQSTIKKRRELGLTTEHFTKTISARSKKGAIRGTNERDARCVPFGYLGP